MTYQLPSMEVENTPFIVGHLAAYPVQIHFNELKDYGRLNFATGHVHNAVIAFFQRYTHDVFRPAPREFD